MSPFLSRFPLLTRHPHTNDSFFFGGKPAIPREPGLRQKLEIKADSGYSFTLIAAHLKSRRAIPEADEADFRLEESKILREWIDARLQADANNETSSFWATSTIFATRRPSEPSWAAVGRRSWTLVPASETVTARRIQTAGGGRVKSHGHIFTPKRTLTAALIISFSVTIWPARGIPRKVMCWPCLIGAWPLITAQLWPLSRPGTGFRFDAV